MNIYKDNCLPYLRKGLSVIPDRYAEKIPLLKGWNDFCYQLPTEEQVVGWGSQYNKTNIALCLGEQSQVVVLDFDSENREIIDLIEHMLPKSPVERKGSKGWARFFKFNGEETLNLKDASGNVIVELLSSNKKITLPPSKHPKGMDYIWVGKELLEVEVEDLPILPPNLFNHLETIIQGSNISGKRCEKVSSGRNASLTQEASRLIKSKKPIDEAIRILVDFDKENHEKPLFTDTEENKLDDAYINATIFFTNHLKSINIKRQRQGKSLEVPLNIIPNNSKNASENSINIFKGASLPKPQGLIKQIFDYINDSSYIVQEPFAMSGALSILGTIVSRKVVFQGATPNLYCMNIADSGSGKDSAIQACKLILTSIKAQHLLGASTYPSEASIIQHLSDINPTRLDPIDEASIFLKTSVKGAAAYQTGMDDLLCQLYSCSNNHFLGKTLATSDKRIGECYRPHINILAATTYKGLSDSLTMTSLQKGLLARFLVFFGDNTKKGRRIKRSPYVPSDLVESLEYWKDFISPSHEGNLTHAADPYELKTTKEANSRLDEIFEEFDDLRVNTSSNDVMRPVVSRLYQQMLKICLISAISSTKIEFLPKVSLDDVEFSYSLIKYFYNNIADVIEENIHDNYRGHTVNQILKTIKRSEEEGITDADLIRNSKNIRTNERDEIIRELVQSGQIVFTKTEDNKFIYKYNGGA